MMQSALVPETVMVAVACAVVLQAAPSHAATRVVRLDLMRHLPQEAPADITPLGDGEWEWHLAKGRQLVTLDLAALGVDPADYDEIRFEIKPLVSQVSMRMTLKGHLPPGEVSRWYLKFKTPTGVWSEGRYEIDLDDDGVYCRRGDPNDVSKTLTVNLHKRVVGYPGEPEWRRARIRRLRLVRHVVSANFKLLETEIEQDGAEVAYVYMLHLVNRTDRPQVARLELDSAKTLHHFGVSGPETVRLAAGASETVPIRIHIPMMKALALPPLYSEPLFPKVSVDGIPDSDVVVLRGYRRFPMWASVPVFNRLVWKPATFRAFVAARAKCFPGIEELRTRAVKAADAALKYRWPMPDFGPPRHGQRYRCEKCRCWFKPLTPNALHAHQCPKCGRIERNNDVLDREWLMRYHGGNGGRIRNLALAWFFTSEERYARKAKEILLDYAAGYAKMPVSGTRSTSGGSRLGLNSLHSSYSTQKFAEGYHYLEGAPCLDEESRARIVAFLTQAGVEVVQHSVEYGNQQAEHFRAYGSVGLATRFWPLAAEAIHGEFGWHELVEFGYTEDGIAHEGGAYHHASFDAMNKFGEFAYGFGLDLYTPRFKRVFDGSLAAGLARTSYELAYRAYRDESYLPRISGRNRGRTLAAALHGVLGLPDVGEMPARSVHLAGAGHVYLRRGNAADSTEIRLNYIAQFDRHEHDRLTTFFYRNGRQIDSSVGRITYGSPRSGWMGSTAAHNCIVIDGADAKTHPSKLIAYDPSPDALIAAILTRRETPLYEGVTQLRCIALIEDYYVVFDRIACDRPRTIDRYQWGRGGATLKLPYAPRAGLADLPHRGQFSGIEGGACGNELRIDFGNSLRMRLVSDGPMQAFKALTVAGYQANPHEVTFARRESAPTATFLAVFSHGKDASPPEARIVRSGGEECVFEVRAEHKTWQMTVDVRAGSATVVRR